MEKFLNLIYIFNWNSKRKEKDWGRINTWKIIVGNYPKLINYKMSVKQDIWSRINAYIINHNYMHYRKNTRDKEKRKLQTARGKKYIHYFGSPFRSSRSPGISVNLNSVPTALSPEKWSKISGTMDYHAHLFWCFKILPRGMRPLFSQRVSYETWLMSRNKQRMLIILLSGFP